MFTGLISHRGEFRGYREGRKALALACAGLEGRLEPGGSLAVNGVCLTLAAEAKGEWRFDLSRETLARTTLGRLRPGDRLNLELPLTLAAPLGGHLVSGHVDGVGKVLRLSARPPGKRLALSFPAPLRPYFVVKGSVAVDGVSLTVAALGPASLEVELVPLTLAGTDLGALRPGAAVNLECDMVGKYVYNFVSRTTRTR